ncbi:MAG TPA: VWA domain-containing protein [Gammaproteobacteria bacterium]|nr:VWA domain-containing protein [Gammaproteobacteria bacterium]
MKGNHHRHAALSILLCLGMISAPIQAEDIEVFFTKKANSVAPNVLFVLDSSGSMESKENNNTRMEILKNSLHEVLKPQEKYKKLNVGIMNFNGNRSGGIDFPITDINSDAHDVDVDIPANTDVGSVIDHISQSYSASGETPMGDALYFASSYFLGTHVFNTGWRGKPNAWDTSSNSYRGGSQYADNPAAYTGSIDSTTVAEIRTRACSPSNPRPIRHCSSEYDNCTTEIHNISARPKLYRINTYSCDSSGLECKWRYPRYKNIDADYPGDASCSNRPSTPQDGDTWVQCRAAREASSYTYERCEEEYTHYETTDGPTATYKSPITHQCQSNHVILLTDGEPTRRDTLYHIASRVRPITGSDRYQDCKALNTLSNLSNNILTYGRCLPELVEYMATMDQAPDLEEKQIISTYTIGFQLANNPGAQDFLKLLADKGQGNYFDADSPDDLVNVFKRIINEVTGNNVSFSAPSLSVDQNNSLATSKYLYRSVFTPSDKPAWSGDIVKTRMGQDTDGNPTFTEEITFASTLVDSQRKIYTYTGTNDDLTDASNALATSNDKLTTKLLAVNTDNRDSLIQWARGLDVKDENNDGYTTDQREHMGDPLHTTPALVNYTTSPRRQVLYVPTNDGLLHAFDISGDTPAEIFAFIPPELLPNLKKLYANSNTDTKVYGLDGNMTIWRSNDGKTYLYIGMRRGGNNYYALDISDPEKPRMLWTIKGGAEDFAELGQTWSTPQLTNVMVGSIKTKALIFGGGYDTDQDDKTKTSPRTTDDTGRAIFIVNAETGEKIWSAGYNSSDFDYDLGLSNSIPSDVRIIDLDGNSLADRIYVGDMGGRIWRIDLDQDNISDSSGYLLADFNDGTETGNRRFYYPPSVALDRQHRLMIAIGSGYRAKPTETMTEDRFYVFEDPNTLYKPATPASSAIIEDDLGDITDILTLTSNKPGWYLRLDKGEKVLAENIIFNGKIMFTSYQPQFETGNSICNLSGNTPRAYLLALADGRPLADLDNTAGLDRNMTLNSVEFIPGSPYIVFSGGGNNGGNSNNDGGDNGGGNNGGDNTPPSSGSDSDSDFAEFFAGEDPIGRDSGLSGRLSWQNR